MRIRYSERGLTFSFKETDTFSPGTRYRYIVDNRKGEVILLPDEEGRYKLSKKGANEKPLVDLRNEEIKRAISDARYMEVEVMDDRIVVHIIKAEVYTDTSDETDLARLVDDSRKTTISISKEQLQNTNGKLYEMLTSAGLLSQKTREDISYVFDTVSLFSGAGLLDLPFKEDDSFDILFAADLNEAACRTYRENIGDHIMKIDMRKLCEKDVPDADLIIGGVCCQGYSNANRAGNISQDIEKRLLVDDYIRMVRAKRPLIFVIENVPQFITKEDGRYLEKVLTGLPEYNVTYSIVNDNELGGYSIRKRMVLIGSAKEMDKVIIPNVEIKKKLTAGDALKKVSADWFNFSDITQSSEETRMKMSCVRPGGNYKDIPGMENLSRHSNFYRRLSADKPAVTLINWRKTLLMPPEGNRILSVSEAAAIMGLSEKFRILGSLDERQQQIANGVTQAIARFIKDIVKNALYKYMNGKLKLA